MVWLGACYVSVVSLAWFSGLDECLGCFWGIVFGVLGLRVCCGDFL